MRPVFATVVAIYLSAVAHATTAGTERSVEAPIIGPIEDSSFALDLASDGSQVWFLWQDRRRDFELYLTRTSADGTYLDPTAVPVALSHAGAFIHGYSLAAGSDGAIVAWADTTGEGFHLFARLFNAQAVPITTVVDLGLLDLGQGNPEYKPVTAAAAGHGGYLVGGSNLYGSHACEVIRIFSDGTIGSRHRVGPDPAYGPWANCRVQRVTATEDGWAVAFGETFDENDGPFRAWRLATLTIDGELVSTAELGSTTWDWGYSTADLAPPLALLINSSWLTQVRMVGDSLVEDWAFDLNDRPVYSYAAAAWSPDRILAVVVDPADPFSEEGPQRLMVTPVSINGTPGETLLLRQHENGGQANNARVVRAGDDWIVAWNDVTRLPYDEVLSRILVQRFALDGTPIGEPFSVARAASAQSYPVIAGDDDGWLVAWHDGRIKDGLFARLVDSQGEPTGDTAQIAEGVLPGTVSVVRGNSGWLIGWRARPDRDDGDSGPVLARYWDDIGSLGDPVEIATSCRLGPVPIAFDGEAFVLLRGESGDDARNVFYRVRIAEDLSIVDGPTLAIADNPSGAALACHGERCLAAWEIGWNDAQCGAPTSAHVGVGLLGDTSSPILLPALGGPSVFDVAGGPAGWLVVWAGLGVSAVRVGTAGTTIEPTLPLVTGPVGDASAMWDGSGWLIALRRIDSELGSAWTSEHRVLRLDAAATQIVEDISLVPPERGTWRGTAIAPGPPGKALVAYSRFDETRGVMAQRVFVRVIETDPPPPGTPGCECAVTSGRPVRTPLAGVVALLVSVLFLRLVRTTR